MTDRWQLAHEVIAEAGALALDYFGRLATLQVNRKDARDVVSEADVAVEEMIRARIGAAYPEDGFLGEETGLTRPDDAPGIWVVDPIDGTQPFVSGLRSWCVSIAYLVGDRVQIGLVFNPAAGELFAGGQGRPASLNGAPVTRHPGTNLTEGLIFLGASVRSRPEQVVPVLDRLLHAGGMFVRNGSGALGLCDVACGRLLGYVEPHINAWDCLGAIGVLESAGCRVNDYLADDGLFSGNPIIAGPPQIYEQLVRLLNG